MYHTFAWTKSLTDATLEEVTVVADQIMTISNSRFMPPTDINIFAARAMGTNLQRVRVTTPRLRQLSPVFLRPLQPTLIGGNDANDVILDRAPLRLRGQEEITMEAIQTSGGAQRGTIIAFAGQNLRPVPAGDVIVVRGTSTTACVANTWTQLTYTLDSSLPAGRYAVVLIEHQSTNGQAVRATFDDQFYRPGAPSLVADANRLMSWWYQYSLGVWGTFLTYSPPRIEVLANSTDNSHQFYFHLVPMFGVA